MSLKGIELDPLLLAGLYSHSIVPDTRTLPAENLIPPVPSLGNNGQNILLLIHNENEPYLSEELFDMLVKIIGACQLSLDDVALVNTVNVGEADWFHLKVQFNPHRVICFGNPFPEITSGKKPNQAWEEENCHFLSADTLEAISKNVKLKAMFWKALQQFFQLNK